MYGTFVLQHRLAFYPCCASDFAAAAMLLGNLADDVVFCDRNGTLAKEMIRQLSSVKELRLTCRFLHGDAREKINEIPQIDVLFYRRDSDGEGGSGLHVLEAPFLPMLLSKMPPAGGLIVSDGSNCPSGDFDQMNSSLGLDKYGWRFSHAASLENESLSVVSVRPIGRQNASGIRS